MVKGKSKNESDPIEFTNEDFNDLGDLSIEVLDFAICSKFRNKQGTLTVQLSSLKKNVSSLLKKWHKTHALEIATLVAALMTYVPLFTGKYNKTSRKRLSRMNKLFYLLSKKYQNDTPLGIQILLSLIKIYHPIIREASIKGSKKSARKNNKI